MGTRVSELVAGIVNLREAQRAYMEVRQNGTAEVKEQLGAAVGAAAREVDKLLAGLDAARIAVFDAIDSERDYQKMRIVRDGSTATDEHPHTPEEFLLYIDHYLNLAKTTASTVWGSECKPAILHGLRKIMTLAAACLEHHGAPQREGFENQQ